MKEKIRKNFNIYQNIIIAIIVMIYFFTIYFAYFKVEEANLSFSLKIISIVLFIFGIVFLEIAYNKKNKKLGLNALEILILSGFTLSIKYIVEIKELEFSIFLIIASHFFSIYYLLKAILLYTKEKRDYLKSLSDIREIVDIKPIKKEAKKTRIN